MARPTSSAPPRSAPPPPSAPAVTPADVPPAGYGTLDLAAGRPVSTTSQHSDFYGSANITAGDPTRYWEGALNSLPQTVVVDLGSVGWVAKVDLALPEAAGWNARSQTIGVYGSQTGPSAATTIVGPRSYVFDANSPSRNSVSVTFSPVRVRYLILQFSATSGWPAAQLGRLSAYS
jgi:hypothetical protein